MDLILGDRTRIEHILPLSWMGKELRVVKQEKARRYVVAVRDEHRTKIRHTMTVELLGEGGTIPRLSKADPHIVKRMQQHWDKRDDYWMENQEGLELMREAKAAAPKLEPGRIGYCTVEEFNDTREQQKRRQSRVRRQLDVGPRMRAKRNIQKLGTTERVSKGRGRPLTSPNKKKTTPNRTGWRSKGRINAQITKRAQHIRTAPRVKPGAWRVGEEEDKARKDLEKETDIRTGKIPTLKKIYYSRG